MAASLSGGVSLGILFVRLPLGVVFLAHGLRKVWGEEAVGVEGFAAFLEGTGVPFPQVAAMVAIGAEIGGGAIVLLGLGFLTRLAALALAATMVVAIFKVHFENGFFIPVEVAEAGPVPWGYEYNVALLGMSMCLFFTGPGRFGLLCGGDDDPDD